MSGSGPTRRTAGPFASLRLSVVSGARQPPQPPDPGVQVANEQVVADDPNGLDACPESRRNVSFHEWDHGSWDPCRLLSRRLATEG
jgi:hypothetical protein